MGGHIYSCCAHTRSIFLGLIDITAYKLSGMLPIIELFWRYLISVKWRNENDHNGSALPKQKILKLLIVASLLHKSINYTTGKIRPEIEFLLYLPRWKALTKTTQVFVSLLIYEFLSLLRCYLNHFSDVIGTTICWLNMEHFDWSHQFFVIWYNLVYVTRWVKTRRFRAFLKFLFFLLLCFV